MKSFLTAWFLLLLPTGTMLHAAVFYPYTFENYTASTGGTSINGQDGWYTPLVASTVDGSVFLYAGNTPGFVANSTGGTRFAGMVSHGPAGLARAQHDFDFSTATLWSVGYDFAGINLNPEITTNNLGSFSLGPEQMALLAIAEWDNTSPGSAYHIFFDRYDAGGNLVSTYPGGAWAGLAQNHWYRMGFLVAARVVPSSPPVSACLVVAAWPEMSLRSTTSAWKKPFRSPARWVCSRAA